MTYRVNQQFAMGEATNIYRVEGGGDSFVANSAVDAALLCALLNEITPEQRTRALKTLYQQEAA